MKKILIPLIVILAAAAAWYFFNQKKYVIVHPHKGDITEAVYGLGKVKSHQKFDVIIGIMSTMTNQYVDEGYNVKEGEPLLQFERAPVVRAPFSGTVTLLRVKKGETALPNMPILRLENLNSRFIELSIEQESALRIQKGQKARISFESLRGNVLNGTVTALFPREDEFIVQVEVNNLQPNVLPGMTADVSVEVGKIKDGILIPVASISEGMVTVKRDGHWKKEQVSVGHANGTDVEVLGGTLKESDEIRMAKEE